MARLCRHQQENKSAPSNLSLDIIWKQSTQLSSHGNAFSTIQPTKTGSIRHCWRIYHKISSLFDEFLSTSFRIGAHFSFPFRIIEQWNIQRWFHILISPFKIQTKQTQYFKTIIKTILNIYLTLFNSILLNTQYSVLNTQYSIYSIFNTQYSILNIQYSILNTQYCGTQLLSSFLYQWILTKYDSFVHLR